MNAANRQALLDTAARLWTPALRRPAAFRTRDAATLKFSLMFFSALASDRPETGLYDLVHQAAIQADALGFDAVWLPERHFHPFGGPYPNPAVLAASLARETTRIRLRAGSVVLPLHHPASVAETWSMVDNLSNGRVEIAFGSGWNPNDFLLAPNNFVDARTVMRDGVETVRRLWRGDAVAFPNGKNDPTPTRIFPRPIQPELPVWISSTGSADTFEWAGAQGFDILTMLISGDLDALALNIASYRNARAAAGLDPAAGRVAIMLHTMVHEDGDRVRREVRAPFMDYVRSALDVQRHGHPEGAALTEAQREQMIAFAYERYTRTAALFGTPADCKPLLDRVAAAGIDEIACLIDFGIPTGFVLEGLPALASLLPPGQGRREGAPSAKTHVDPAEPIAIIGMACRLPGSPNPETFWANLQSGQDLLTPPPPGRGTALPRAGFLDDVDGFDAAGFNIAPAEAAAMDPHHRLFMEAARAAIEDSGQTPESTRGTQTAVFAAMYSSSFAATAPDTPLDGVAIAGQMPSMAANRVSFAFDWSGPSEVVNTACSSGLVAVHRAVAALRAGECDAAIAGGVSLLLSDAESAALARLGILSPTGQCRAFDRDADGQARGEGVGALLLKPLAAARRDNNPIHAVITGSAVNHGGARGGSLTLPNPRRQAACMNAALARANLAPADIGYIEAHGGGTQAGDLAEASALEQVFPAGCRVGSVKSNIGSLDAAGGIAALIKTVLALQHATIPATLHRDAAPDLLAQSPLRFPQHAEPWGNAPRRALVHAYGLGGVNAAIILQEGEGPRPARPAVNHPRQDFPRSQPARQNIVADFYDFATRPELGNAEIFLTLAPFPTIVPGFSWTRTFQDPAANPAHWDLMRAAQKEMRDVLFAPVDFTRVTTALDFGCGLGTDLIALATRHPTLQATGYTISPNQAAFAQSRVAAQGLGNRVQIHNRDSAADPFPGQFDLIFGFEVAHHIQDKDALFANIAAHLAPGGLLILADNLANTVAPIDLPQLGAWTLDREAYADLFTRHGLRIRDCIDASPEIANFLADPEIEPMLHDEAKAAAQSGRDNFALAAAVQRSWHAFGEALRTGLLAYILLAAEPAPKDDALQAHNRQQVGLS